MNSWTSCRVARPSSLAWIFTKTFFHIVVFSFIFLVVLPWIVATIEPQFLSERFRFAGPLAQSLGLMVILVGVMISFSSAYFMIVHGKGTPLPLDAARELVIRGPYHYVRNPMAIGGILQGIGVGIFLGSPLVVIYALIGALLWHFCIKPWEEADLAQRFGEPYQRYREHVRCWVPCRPMAYETSPTTINVPVEQHGLSIQSLP